MPEARSPTTREWLQRREQLVFGLHKLEYARGFLSMSPRLEQSFPDLLACESAKVATPTQWHQHIASNAGQHGLSILNDGYQQVLGRHTKQTVYFCALAIVGGDDT